MAAAIVRKDVEAGPRLLSAMADRRPKKLSFERAEAPALAARSVAGSTATMGNHSAKFSVLQRQGGVSLSRSS